MNQRVYPVKRKQELEITIDKIAYGGEGVGRIDNYVVFVKDALPGDRVKVRIQKRRPNYAKACLLEVIQPSGLRKPAPCPYFDWCGGCTWQNVDYVEQLYFKRNHIVESLGHLAKIENLVVLDTIPSEKVWAYRNKMEFSFADKRWLLPAELNNPEIDRSFALGLHVPGTFDKILDIDNCLLQSDTANNILKMVSNYVKDKKLDPYGIRSHEGFLRFLVIRESTFTKEIMVNIVTSYKNPESLLDLSKMLKDRFPQLSSVINNINTKKAQIALGEEEIVLFGKDFIVEKLCGMEFKISANSFFQTNTLQAERLYNKVIEYAQLDKTQVIWDLYSGTGTIALILSDFAKFIYSFEIMESAVQDAVNNATKYGKNNVKFIAGDLITTLPQVEKLPDVVIVDPPRSGMHKKICGFLNQCGAKRIIYVSCNPTTMSRDLLLMENEYKAVKVQPVDMFPHTYHIEVVVLLEKR